jgi:hypothetical protein
MYDSQLGRFLSRDPAGLRAGDRNPYVYVRDSPTGWVDPLGLGPTRVVPMNVQRGEIEGVVTLELQTQEDTSWQWVPFWTWWVNVGAARPVGPNPKSPREAQGKTVITDCLVGAHLPVLKPASAPGPIAEIGWLFRWLPDAPNVATLMQAPRYAEVDENHCASLIKWMETGRDLLQRMGRVCEADTQRKAITCLTNMCRKLGWPIR